MHRSGVSEVHERERIVSVALIERTCLRSTLVDWVDGQLRTRCMIARDSLSSHAPQRFRSHFFSIFAAVPNGPSW